MPVLLPTKKAPSSLIFGTRGAAPAVPPEFPTIEALVRAVWGPPTSLGGGLRIAGRPAHTIPGSLTATACGCARVVARGGIIRGLTYVGADRVEAVAAVGKPLCVEDQRHWHARPGGGVARGRA